MNGGVSEDAYAEQPALEWLQEVGWGYLHGTGLIAAPGAPERQLDSDVVLRATLERSVARLNPELPAAAVRRVVELAMTSEHPTPIVDHKRFHDMLLSGIPVTWIDEDGERSTRAKLIDWETPWNNEFTAINQLTIVQGGHNRRPDVLLYVNGLPLGQLELKNPALNEDGPTKAVNQVHHYSKTIPGLYRYVEVIGVSDLLHARVGTVTTPAAHFAEWKSMDPEESRQRSQLEILIRSVFSPAGLLDLIRNFVLFESSGAKTWKVMAKYHQVDAVNRAVEATAEAMADKTRRAGVVWHTQGAGKSYSMVFYVTKLRRDRRFANPTIVCVTDTNDLDNQLSETFSRQEHLRAAVDQAESIDGERDPKSLYRLLDVPANGIVFTTIQKFGRREREDGPMPIISARENVIVIADEAHRSQYRSLAQNITRALPNATRIGFTGTPIERADRSTRNAFGDYISVYRMAQAQEDGATVPIYYDSRQVPIAANREEMERVQAILDQETDEGQTEATSEFARMDAIIGAPDRIDRVVDDLVAHFEDRCRTLPGKAMLVAYSRRAACEYALRLRGRLGDNAVDAVMNASATDGSPISDFRKSKQQLKALEKRFKDPESPLRVIVVKNMWLTGFDAPVLHTLYIDKPMRDHGLLQAIARVNRVFEAKPGGLVVDYIGIGDDLRAGLKAYAQGDVDDVVIPLDVARRHLVERHEVMCDLLHGIAFRPPEDASHAQRATVLALATQESVARSVLDDDASRRFLDEQAQYAKWFALVSPNEPSTAQRYDHDFFATVAKYLRLARTDGSDGGDGASPEARRAVEQFFSDGLSGGEIIDVFAVAGEERPEISVLSDEFLDDLGAKVRRPELQIALLKKLLAGQIRARLSTNRTQHKRFSDELGALLSRYNEQQLSSAEVIKGMVDLAKSIRSQTLRNDALGLSREETAFYDAIVSAGDDWVDDPRLRDLARAIVEQVRRELAVDWTERANLEARVRASIKRLLRRHRFAVPERNGGIEGVAERVFQQARVLYRRYPEIAGEWTDDTL
ncbi:type I restriction endonuclease subunit R [Conexibacter sp. JD483]|uniref:type I restriction endonuclease subunit R n=1 Tax=unclassified Conexibacter TaxID=2627773 RepID=UPI00272045E2|nr:MULTISPECIES: type I restriction endonuclease subunit R [unclassified Conexibacter]MDO8184769.1 type I restriction endonuclease subunit R [Conexibacter sp. CPCC 205706]MDO8196544.1 type I restriction endonuclease subunit R [Conexibacter sp. CPCC 205762]MDR9369030.1 type I restriction endonuclease subunit R [Conexibacter sp. JD483]